MYRDLDYLLSQAPSYNIWNSIARVLSKCDYDMEEELYQYCDDKMKDWHDEYRTMAFCSTSEETPFYYKLARRIEFSPSSSSKFLPEFFFQDKFSHISKFSIVHCKQLLFVTQFKRLPNVHTISLINCPSFRDISQFASLPNVKKLKLLECDSIRDFSAFSKLTHLESLSLEIKKTPEDISFLSPLVNLKSLILFETELLKDISPLKKLVNLEDLNLVDSHLLSDVSALGSLKSLRRLNLSACKSIRNVSALAMLPMLSSLTLRGCPYLDVKPDSSRMINREEVQAYQDKIKKHYLSTNS